MVLTRRGRAALAAASAVVVAGAGVGAWALARHSSPGAGTQTLHVLDSPSASSSATASPTLVPTPTPVVRHTPSPAPTVSAIPSPTPSPTVSAMPSPTATPTESNSAGPADIGTGQYASVLPHVTYSGCTCDIFNFSEPPKNIPAGLSLTCTPPADKLPSGSLFELQITVHNDTDTSESFRELAGPRFVWLSLATDRSRSQNMNGGWADNAGHTGAGNGWWDNPGADPTTSAYEAAAGTVSHTIAAHDSIVFTLIGASVRPWDLKPLVAGRYNLIAGFLADAHDDVWACPAVTAEVG